MSTITPTDAHRDLVVSVLMRCISGNIIVDQTSADRAAQLIAESEARAVEEMRKEREDLREAKDAALDSYDGLLDDLSAAMTRAEKAEAELAKDRARLWWVLDSTISGEVIDAIQWSGNESKNYGIGIAAIDEAMKEESK